jgi:hypothetical protein
MISKLNRQECIDKFPILPLSVYNEEENDFDDFFPDTFASYILTVSGKSLKGHISILAKSLKTLANCMDCTELICLGDSKTPWLALDHDYKPAKEALQYLTDNKIGKRFNGALIVNEDDLIVFIKHLAWLVRCNAIAPYVHFTDPGQNVIGSLCQYANLHISTISQKADDTFLNAVERTSLEFLVDGNCQNKYYKTGAIKGRRMIF